MVSPAPSADPLFPPSTVDQMLPSNTHHQFHWPESVQCPSGPETSPYPHAYSVGARPHEIEASSSSFSGTTYLANNRHRSNDALFAYDSESYYQPASCGQPTTATIAFDAGHSFDVLESPRSRTDTVDHAPMPTSIPGAEVQLPGFTSPESAFYQYQNRMEGQLCQICGELAAGFHHGAYVCEACKASQMPVFYSLYLQTILIQLHLFNYYLR